ncbi:MAG: hypothetical protein ACRD36_11740, partial [Candidatus Acidiferrum sp.]
MAAEGMLSAHKPDDVAAAADSAHEVNGNGALPVLEVEARPTAETDIDPAETKEWLDSLDGVLQTQGVDRARFLLTQLQNKALRSGVHIPFSANT